MNTLPATQTIAVIGAGAAGLAAAHLLQRRHRVTLFEKLDYPGGHAHTVTLAKGPDAGTPVDTGFIVMNHRNYPLFTRLLEQLGVGLRDSEMSFSYHDERTGLQYSGSGLNGLFGQRRNLFKPAFHRMVRDLFRFFRETHLDLNGGRMDAITLGDYLRRGGYGDYFIRHHIVPMGAAIWSMPCAEMMQFPASSFVRFFENHGLLTVSDRPQWKTLVGGSRTYVDRILQGFGGTVRLKAVLESVRRHADHVAITLAGGETSVFDQVVLAAHANESLALLADPSDEERRLLGAWRYSTNHTVLHHDPSVMPPLRRVWASWNYTRERASAEDGPATLTYDMNRLQGLRTQEPCFVTLNHRAPLPADRVVTEIDYDHPAFTRASMATQPVLPSLNGVRRTWFCGSYFGYGFHEDAIRSGVQVAQAFGVDL
jgi:predicted NAD/FAD-binding protein